MRTIRYGSRGPDVELAQLALQRSGYLNEQPDGLFGARTEAAVLAFQKAYGLSADGVVGPQTWNRLRPYLLGYFRRTVVTGDTYWKLAEQYGTTVNAIATANPNVNPQNLTLGSTLVIPFGFEVVPDNVSFTYELLTLVIEGLQVRYPFLRSGSIGRSVMGKELWYVSLGTGNTPVGYNGTHHANEWITSPLLMLYVERYAAAYAGGKNIYRDNAAALYEATNLFVVPMVNPDGADLVTGAIDENSEFYAGARQIANDYPAISFPNGWKANIVGTDLNLNYPAGWEQAREIKFAQGFTTPAPRDYVGTAPLSAPESRAMYNFTRDRNFALTLSYHTQGEVIYWKYRDYNPPRSYAIALQMGEASGYAVEETPYESGFAGYKDWFIQDFNRPGYTIEAGIGENPLPISQLEDMYAKNVGILTIGLREAGK